VSELYSASREGYQEAKSKALSLTSIKYTIIVTIHIDEQENQVRPSEK